MPFTNPWSDNLPPVGEIANKIGIDMRQTRLDLHERLGKLFTDFTADPLVLQDWVAGQRSAARIVIPACSFLNDLNTKTNVLSVGRTSVFVGAPEMYAPIPGFLVGCKITLVEWLVDIHNVTSLDMDLMQRTFANAPAAEASLNHKNIAVAGANIVNGGALAATLADTFQYYLKVVANGGAGNEGWIFAARLTFDRPATP